MSDILFVTPVFTENAKRECIGTLLLSTILKQNGIDVDIYRYYESGTDVDFNTFIQNSVNNILSKKAKIVSFYCRIDSFLSNILVSEKIKESSPETIIVFGGPQSDLVAKETLEQFPWVDYCCCGEGESTIYPFVSSLLDGADVTHVKGLVYRDADGNIISNELPELVHDLDTLVPIDYSFISKDLMNATNALSIEVGRGCPFNCAYCTTSLFWQRKFRLKSPERIIDEMKKLNEEYGIKTFGFQHDLFTANKKLVSKFCQELRNSGLDFKWSCSSRTDTIDEDIIEEMAKSGLQSIFLGIETGSPRMQKLTHKRLDIEKSVSIIKHLLRNNIKVVTSFMFGFPEETYEDVEQTLQLMYRLKKMGVHSIPLHLCSITPGTEYFEKYRDELVWTNTISNHTGDLGFAEYEEFIHDHKDVFSYFLGLENELRTRLARMDSYSPVLLDLYETITIHDPDKTENTRLVDFALAFTDANSDLLAENMTSSFSNEEKFRMCMNYLSTVYEAEKLEVFRIIFTFKKDLADIQANKNTLADVKTYDISINDITNGKKLSEIENKPCMVYFKKVNNKTSYVVKSLFP